MNCAASLLMIVTMQLVLSSVNANESSCCGGIGIKTPERRCMLPWDDFAATVVNATWRAIYTTTAGLDDIVPLPIWKQSATWEILPDLTVRRLFIFWSPEIGSCFFGNNTQYGGACSNTAKLEVIEDEGIPFMPINRADRFASPDPERVLIMSICMNEELKCDGNCRNSYLGVFIKDTRTDSDGDGYPDGDLILNDIPWCLIEDQLNDCFNASMWIGDMYRKLDYTWRGQYECRFEEGNP